MTNEIPRQEWAKFFEAVARNYPNWETKVESLDGDFGAQVLSRGLPLNGFMFVGGTHGFNAVEIKLGDKTGALQTPTIFNIRRIFFATSEDHPGGIIEIEDKRGDKTLIYLIQPINVLAMAFPRDRALAFA